MAKSENSIRVFKVREGCSVDHFLPHIASPAGDEGEKGLGGCVVGV